MDFINADPFHDNAPIDVREQCQYVIDFCDSPGVVRMAAQRKPIHIRRERLKVSLFHLNLKPRLDESNRPRYSFLDSAYPYDPVYSDPFPCRPTMDMMEQALHFMDIIFPNGCPASTGIRLFLERNSQVAKLSCRISAKQNVPTPLALDWILTHPVDAYITMRRRLLSRGESASFPEFAATVNHLTTKLLALKEISNQDPILSGEICTALHKLQEVESGSGRGTATHAPFYGPYPYRRTILAIENAVSVFDMFERCRYPESDDWHEVGQSWIEPDSNHKLLSILSNCDFYRLGNPTCGGAPGGRPSAIGSAIYLL